MSQNKFLIWIYRIEDIIVYSLFSSILFFAVAQIILRNYFDSGFIWGESLLRILVLWLGLAGAILADRKGKQISIDVLTQFLPEKYKNIVGKINNIFAATVCLLVSYYSYLFVLLEYEDGAIAFENVPSWLTESIIPIGFGILGIKYVIKIFNSNKI